MKDFDAAFAELDGGPIVLKLFGREWEIKRDVPASAVLATMRAKAGMEGDDQLLGAQASIEAARAFIGTQIVDEWLDLGLSFERLIEILAWVQAERRGGEGDEGEATAPTPTT